MSTTTATPPDAAVEPGRSKKKLVLVLAVVIVAALAGGWFFFLSPAESSEPKPGEVVAMEPIQINLASGHYLRVGLALQLTEGAHEVDASKAADAAITVFSGLPVAEANKPAVREKLRHQLAEKLIERYHGDVMEVYFTEYVTQ